MKNQDRPLVTPARPPVGRRGAFVRKVAAVLAIVLLLAFVASRLDLTRDMRRLDVRVASGEHTGNYYALVGDLATLAAKNRGRVVNVESAGSLDNVKRLVAARESGSCDVAFGLAQDGSDWGTSGKLQLIGRLTRAESVFFLGRHADDTTELAKLAHAKIGVGPDGSGTAAVARAIFDLPDLRPLGVTLSSHPLAEQMSLAEKGDLDLAVFVIDEDAPLIARAVHDDGLQIAGFSHIDVIARRLPHLRTGRIGAGQYDAVRVLPAADKRVLRVETLVVGNGCAGRSATIDLMMLLAKHTPGFLQHNKDTVSEPGLDLAPAARAFYQEGGPELADEYVPWLVDVMPPANWAYVVMGVSLLFNAMGMGHRFRLWRIDDARVKLENEVAHVFGPSVTLGEIEHMEPSGELARPEARRGIASVVERLEALAARSRRQSLSVLVPMGQEMAYRYQEGVIYETIAVLRAFLRRSAPASDEGELSEAASPPGSTRG